MMGLVVVLLVAAINKLGSRKEAMEQARKTVQDPGPGDIVDVGSVVRRGTIGSASWRKGGAMAEDAEDESAEPESDPWDLFGDKARKRERAETDLRETVKDVNGLGIYVAPADEDGDE